MSRLYGKYKSPEEQQQLRVVLNYLVEERLLFPYFATSGEDRSGLAQGITPKGLVRLEKLRHPRLAWMKENWFALVIALITGSSAIAGAVLSALLR